MSLLGKRGRAKDARTSATVTWNVQGSSTQPSPDPVLAVRQVLPEGLMFWLDAHRWEGRPRRWLSVGSAKDRDIALDDRTVSDLHCFLCRDRKTARLHITDADSKNGILLNGTRVRDAEVEAGTLVSLGGIILLACGRAGAEQRPTLTGQSLHDVLVLATQVYGSERQAAAALAVEQSTFHRWLAQEKFKVPCGG